MSNRISSGFADLSRAVKAGMIATRVCNNHRHTEVFISPDHELLASLDFSALPCIALSFDGLDRLSNELLTRNQSFYLRHLPSEILIVPPQEGEQAMWFWLSSRADVIRVRTFQYHYRPHAGWRLVPAVLEIPHQRDQVTASWCVFTDLFECAYLSDHARRDTDIWKSSLIWDIYRSQLAPAVFNIAVLVGYLQIRFRKREFIPVCPQRARVNRRRQQLGMPPLPEIEYIDLSALSLDP